MSDDCVRDAAADESDRLHHRVQRILQVGLWLSVALMLLGLTLTLARGGGDAPAVRLGDLFGAQAALGVRITAMGILVMAMTPAFRVLALVALWWRERDTRFVVVALVVITTLVASVLLGKG